MARRSIFLSLFSALFLLLWIAAPVNAQEQEVRPPSRQVDTDFEFTKSVPVKDVTPAEDTQRMRAKARERQNSSRPPLYGKVLSTDFTPERHGVWEQLPSGDWLWRLHIRSKGAVSLSVGFSPFQLPRGAELFVHGTGEGVVRGPYRTDGTDVKTHQTPLVHGEKLTIEIRVPDGRRSDVNLRVDRVVHGFDTALPSPEGRKRNSLQKSRACNVDVACEPGWDWGKQIRSVARYTFEIEVEGQTFRAFCSGSLVNNTGDTPRPFFLTAEHCVSTPQSVSTMTFYWNYQSPTCREPGSDQSGKQLPIRGQTSEGATLRARYGNVHSTGSISGKSDLILVEIDDGDGDGMEADADDNEFLADYNLYLNGWDRANEQMDGIVGIHHPAGHAKRISVDRDPTTFDGWNTAGTTHFRLSGWEVGTTEGGSSGSPAFNTEGRVVGVLSGGFANDRCGAGSDNFYGRLSRGFEEGDYFGTTMADFLDPEDTGQKTLDGREVSPDTEPPAQISTFRLEQASKKSVTLAWEAPGDDGSGGGKVTRYEVRYSVNEPISSFEDFKNAQPVRNAPSPASPGTKQSVSVDVDPDSSYYFGIVAFDDVFRRSTLETLDNGLVGTAGVRVLPVAPNPVQQQARAAVVVEETQSVQVGLYDALGRRVKLLVDRDQAEPYREIPVRIDVSSLSSGMYFLRAVGETGSSIQKLPVVK